MGMQIMGHSCKYIVFPLVFLMFGGAGAGDARPAAVRPVAAGRLAAGPGAAGLDVTEQVGAGQDAAEQVEGVQDAAGQRAAEPHKFHFDDLSFATANFSKYNGRGAYEDVYLEDLEDQSVSLRILSDEPHPEEEFTAEFDRFLELGRPNLVRNEGVKQLFGYEDVPFLKNGSCADLLHDPSKEPPDWSTRVAAGAAEGLQYPPKCGESSAAGDNPRSFNASSTREATFERKCKREDELADDGQEKKFVLKRGEQVEVKLRHWTQKDIWYTVTVQYPT